MSLFFATGSPATELSDDQHFQLAEATLKQVQNRMKFRQHERKISSGTIIASSNRVRVNRTADLGLT